MKIAIVLSCLTALFLVCVRPGNKTTQSLALGLLSLIIAVLSLYVAGLL
jgi:hypothetical protein